MFSTDLLPLILEHDFFLFGGASEWPENVYGRDTSNHYERRYIRRPLIGEAHVHYKECKKAVGETAFSVEYTPDGSITIMKK